MSTVTIRPARAEEAGELSDLAVRSKAHWGYSSDFIDACRAELTVHPDRLAQDGYDCFVAESDGRISGFGAIGRIAFTVWELDALFVDPPEIGTGIGGALMGHAKSLVLEYGGTELIIQGDPHAASFYLAAGAVPAGSRASGSIPGRMLPLFRIMLTS